MTPPCVSYIADFTLEAGDYGMKKKFHFKQERVTLTLLFLPFLIYIIAFKYVPILGWGLSLIRYKPGLQFWQCDFVGLDNFKLIFTQGDTLLKALRNTFVLSGLGLLFFPIPLIFAILLSEIKSNKFKKSVQILTTVPHFVSYIIIYSLAFAIFSTEGVLNTVLLNLGIIERPTNTLANNDIVWIFHSLLGVWKGLGWNAIIYFAAIAGIDSELYEAASIDGAGRFQKILHITLPGVSSTFFTLLLLQISHILESGLDHYLAFYNSVVADKILTLDLYTYRLGLVSGDYSYSTAIGILKTFVSLVLLFSANAASKKIRGESMI